MENVVGDRGSASRGFEIREKPLRAVKVAVHCIEVLTLAKRIMQDAETPCSKNHLAHAAARDGRTVS